MCIGLVLIVAITGELSEDKSYVGSASEYVEEIPFVTKKCRRSVCLVGSVGQYVVFPVDKNE
jgi:hypothetical protein